MGWNDPIATVKSTPAPAIDTTVLDTLQEILQEGIVELIDIYLDDTPRLIQKIRDAENCGDQSGIKRFAHSLKSSSANLGALRLAELAASIEHGVGDPAGHGLNHSLQALEQEFLRVRSALQSYR